ncbi:uncharacterized protein STEHIDRAFT_163570 [Stereum hirsutum FP-91666 SS1]|uniref:Uncharacterized protein n=1 Tax=Stereum hirsutum (strain FP-91666) TaxID=721885 RepID=R7RZ00_STEHR|nr:uncharacterized protein STEHIDRAFT_163570 [Stereum hirsutum FP-91666 SS1]EIM79532.1 hypothetical protein STEHIDRAFT_163570 [Stereum hirsutum FP-91666 SS1]
MPYSPNATVDLSPEAELLFRYVSSSQHDTDLSLAGSHSMRTAPLFTNEALNVIGTTVLPQRAVYGNVLHSLQEPSPLTKLYVNTNAPFSAVVCGLQGSGKSHSTAVLLEGCLIQDRRLGTLPVPLCGLLFHFDSAAGSGFVQPCEAAYLAVMDGTRGGTATAPDVTVLTLPNRVGAMKSVYANLPGVKVEALRFASGDISGERLLAMMKVDDHDQMPLYMELVMTLLRDMEVFDYNEFRAMLAKQKINGSQKAMLNLRLALLDSCLRGGNANNCISTHFRQGALMIVE